MDEFLEACRLSGKLELEITNQDGGSVGRWSLSRPFALLGRDARADVVLNDEQVSKRLGYLRILDGMRFGGDLGSRAGVTLRGSTAPSGWVRPGDILGIGPYHIRWRGAGRDDDVGAELPSPLTFQSLDGLGWPEVM